jgi:hypothetical protein
VAAHPRRVSPLLAFILGVMAAVVAMLVMVAYAGARAPRPHMFALDLRRLEAPRVPDTPSLPPPPIPRPQ